MPQEELGALVSRSSSYVSGVFNGFWAPDPSFVRAVADVLGKRAEALFTAELLQASELRASGAGVSATTTSAGVGRYGRQPAYWLLRARGIPQAKLGAVTAHSQGYVSQVLNGSGLPDRSFVKRAAEFLNVAADELFSSEVLQATSRPRPPAPRGAPPSQYVGRYGRQPAYFALKDHGVRHQDLANIVGRSTGFVSAVLNGFSIPNGRFVDAVRETLGRRSKGELFTAELLQAMEGR